MSTPAGHLLRVRTTGQTHLVGNILSDIRSSQSSTRCPKHLLDQIGKRLDIRSVDFDTLDGGDGDRAGGNDTLGLEFLQYRRQAVRHDEQIVNSPGLVYNYLRINRRPLTTDEESP